MIAALRHRGPDASGTWVSDATALGHTRLAIIDLTAAGNQPMVSTDGRCALVFNGEIYNYRELRHELQQEGERFQSTSDTEVILHGYRKWGLQVLERLRGMFAFAIWDNQRHELLLARDGIGIKPLFYARLPQGIVFGSEIKALLAHPAMGKNINPAAIDAYLEMGYVPGPETIFRNIRALGPGHWLQYRENELQSGLFWAPNFMHASIDGNEADLIDALDHKLNDAVKSHLVADVPVGAFLSGGIDSSLVAAIAQRHMRDHMRTFTIGFSGGGDERAYAAAVARHIGSKHHEKLVTADSVRFLPEMIANLEQPFFDNSILPTYLVSQFARQQVKVVLSGDGGDEPFAGYEWTRFALGLPDLPLQWKPKGWQWAYRSGVSGLLKKLAFDISHSGDERYLRRLTVSKAMRHWLYTPDYLSQIQDRNDPNIGQILDAAPVRDKRDRFLYADLCAYLPEDVLFKVDRMSMAHALEVRVPLLDQDLLSWVLRLPFGMRYRRARGKYLLRKVAARYLPPIVLKPRKQGFGIPVGRWLRGELLNPVKKVFLSERFKQRGIIRPQAALELLEMHLSNRYELGHRLWSLVMLEAWARIWVDGQNPEQSLLTG
jgi:asparagine synthase (glutamine-hydrolysing)